ncbi:MAG TPA: SDR family oxidoreductase [Chitinophagales bacterium]|nr:SDR family oxidoreductase [Chitinophagales bacterium]
MSYSLITGASRGIGRAIAFELASRKRNVLLTARSQAQLEETAATIQQRHGVEAAVFALDLSLESAPEKILSFCRGKNIAVDILVNNAGYGLWGDFEKLPLNEVVNMMRLNMENIVKLTHLFIPELKKKTESYILNVASTAGYQAIPKLAVYAASKAFLISFTRALRHELKAGGISVSCLSPGTTTTDFIQRAQMSDAIRRKAEKVTMPPEAVARIAVDGMFSGKAEIIPGAMNILTVQLASLAPKIIVERIAASIYKD